MEIRLNDQPTITGYSNSFNMFSINEVVVYFKDGDCDSMYIHELDVYINNQWKSLSAAFKDRDCVPNSLNSRFEPPTNEEAKERGWND